MRKSSIHQLITLWIFLLINSVAYSEVPKTVSFQGYLAAESGDAVADGNYKLKFELHTNPDNGSVVWEETHTSVSVTNGIFSVLLGSINPVNVSFDQQYFVAISVNDGSPLQPFIPLTSVPYSLGIADSVVVGNKIADGQVLRTLILDSDSPVSFTDSLTIQSGANIDFDVDTQNNTVTISAEKGSGGNTEAWSLDGNTGIDTSDFIGTLDTSAFKIKVNNEIAFQIRNSSDPEFDTPLPIILGGGQNRVTNAPESGGAFIGGGGSKFSALANRVEGPWATIVGGRANIAAEFGFVGAGNGNQTLGTLATAVGGQYNRAVGSFSFVGGGSSNRAFGETSVVPGGELNHTRGDFSFAAGLRARANHNGAFVWNDATATAEADTFASTAANQFLISAEGGVGIGTNQPSSQLTVDGTIESKDGGFRFPDGSTQTTAAPGDMAVWRTNGNLNTDPETEFIGTTDNTQLTMRVNNYTSLRIAPAFFESGSRAASNFILGHPNNSIAENLRAATISGGGNPFNPNEITANYATISGGQGNTVAGNGATVGGGGNNDAGGEHATIGGGSVNEANGEYATIAGGIFNRANGDFSMAAGARATALHEGTFVWADNSSVNSFSSTGANQYLIRAVGGVGIGTDTPSSELTVNGEVDADAYQANTALGSNDSPGNGRIYSDNVVYAWARVNADGSVVESFGCDVNRQFTGTYTVTYKTPLASGSAPVVNAISANDVVVATVSGNLVTSCTVNLKSFIGNAFQAVDYAFTIQVVGRP
jgi:hypothetical protein